MGNTTTNTFAPPISSGGNFTLTPSGAHVARCCQIIYLGSHKEEYMGQDKGWVQKCRIGWELPLKKHKFDETRGEEPFMIGREYTYSMHEKATLRLMLESLRGKKYSPEAITKFDLMRLIGFTALITVVHETKKDGRQIAKLTNIIPVPAGMEVPPAILPTLTYSVLMGRDHPDFKKLPQFLQEKCAQCKEWQPPTPEEQAAEEAGAETPLAGGQEESADPF